MHLLHLLGHELVALPSSDVVLHNALQIYYTAKQCSQPCSPEEFAVALARHFVHTYPKARSPGGSGTADGYQRAVRTRHRAAGLQVSKAKVWVEQAPWQRACLGGQLHNHGSGLPLACCLNGGCWQTRAADVSTRAAPRQAL